jgi:hypothetical protein
LQLPFFSAGQVHAALGYRFLAEALCEAFREGCTAPLRHVHDVTGEGDRLLLMPAWHSGRRSQNEVTLFKSVGTALEDLCAARRVLERTAKP